ncbi:MAG: hypothetical protein ACI8TV_001182 [Porticoccaceae bacterium]|jgi:hypothetical protein
MSATLTPVFLFSLPRSGSTLLQRVIASHPKVDTVAEPWTLLPLLSVFDEDISRSKYGHSLLVEAVDDLCHHLDNGVDDYYLAVRAFAQSIYAAASNKESAEYFLDKTPRYHLVADKIIEAFPDARFIILWRNPLATLGSRIHSYGHVWRPYNYDVDLKEGLKSLVKASQLHKDKVHTVCYEQLMISPQKTLEALFDYIGLKFDVSSIEAFRGVDISGQMGDKTGINSYEGLSQEPLSKWKSTLASPVRKWWARSYLNFLGADDLRYMGYDIAQLHRELGDMPSEWAKAPEDLIRLIAGVIRLRVNGRRN